MPIPRILYGRFGHLPQISRSFMPFCTAVPSFCMLFCCIFSCFRRFSFFWSYYSIMFLCRKGGSFYFRGVFLCSSPESSGILICVQKGKAGNTRPYLKSMKTVLLSAAITTADMLYSVLQKLKFFLHQITDPCDHRTKRQCHQKRHTAKSSAEAHSDHNYRKIKDHADRAE